MRNGTAKKAMLLVVWLALLVGLVVWITRFNPETGGNVAPSTNPVFPTLDTAKLAAEWPQIVAHAAAPPRGTADAKYTLAEFGDFQCPQCGKARPFLESLLKRYPAQVNLIFIHRPFPQIHHWAIPAGGASEVAAAQGKFWPMYDILYQHQDDLEPGFYSDYAAQAGLSKAPFQKAFDAGRGQETVAADAAFADTLGIVETPTILLHDNAAGTVMVYVGLDGTKTKSGSPQYPGLRALVAQPPWGL